MKKNIMIILLIFPLTSFSQNVHISGAERARKHREIPDQKYLFLQPGIQKKTPGYKSASIGFFTSQVNVDGNGNNIIGDAANEPSIAVDPTNPDKMAIGWRQFDNVQSNYRQAGYGYTSDGGQNWTFPGVIEPFVFRSDPVLDYDAEGNIYYNSLSSSTGAFLCKVFKSSNGGATWSLGTEAHGGDKQWMAIDRTNGPGKGNLYSAWNFEYSSCQPGSFTRSIDAGSNFEDCVEVIGNPYWGTMEVGPSGELYIAGAGSPNGVTVAKSINAQTPGSVITWNFETPVDLDGYVTLSSPVNPVGILGQVNIDVDRSNGPGRGNVYVLASVVRISDYDPADVMFAKSTDGGITFSTPQRINTDVSKENYQWFGTMSVAPNGRIDVIWLDTRVDFTGGYLSALFYCYSEDQGTTWSINKQLSEPFDPKVGYPQQEKLGDYFDMVSDNTGAHLAWANTLNGEQDVYYTHIIPTIVGMAGTPANPFPCLSIFPNSFRDHTTIRYKIPANCFVTMSIFNIHGDLIKTLVEKNQSTGWYAVYFSDETLPAGFYICRLSTGSQTETTRFIKL